MLICALTSHWVLTIVLNISLVGLYVVTCSQCVMWNSRNEPASCQLNDTKPM